MRRGDFGEVPRPDGSLDRLKKCVLADALCPAQKECVVDLLDEALRRAEAFIELGADMTFVEAPESVEEMRRYCEEIPGLKMANMVEEGKTPWQSPQELQDIGYDLVAFPLTLLMANVAALQRAAESLRSGKAVSGVSFEELQEVVGFPDYWRRGDLYRTRELDTEDDESTPKG